jgi:hypothetical protein
MAGAVMTPSPNASLSPAPEPAGAYAGIPLRRRSAPGDVQHLGASAEEVLHRFDEVIRSGTSEALLLWPQRPDGVAVFHALAALGRIGTCDQTPLATLLFPWSRGVGGIQRTLLVDRDFLSATTLPALNRSLSAPGPAFGCLMALHSLKHVFSSGKKDKRFKVKLEADPGIVHPTLFEITPQHGVQNSGLRPYGDQFLRRLRRHTWIGDQSAHIEAATDPAKTPFFLFGVHADAVRVKLLRDAGLDPRHGGRVPDIILLDLTRRGRNRLGAGWRQSLTRFFATICDLYAASQAPPILAVTDDVFVLRSLKWQIIKDYEQRRGTRDTRGKRPEAARLVLHPKPDPLEQEVIRPGALPALKAEVYGSDVLKIVESALKLRRALLASGDDKIADAVTTAMQVIQNLIGLPGSPKEFHDFLVENYEGYERQNMGARYDPLAPRSRIQSALQQGLAGVNHKHLSQFLDAYDKLRKIADSDNPGSKLFDKCISELVRKSTRSIVVFSSELLRGFAEWRLDSDPAISRHVGRKLLLVDRREAIEELELDGQEQKLFHRIVFVEPFPDDLLHVLMRPWLPQNVIILGNLALAEQARRRIHILRDLEGAAPIHNLLAAVETEFARVLQGHSVEVPDLDAPPALPRLGMLDLTTASTYGSGSPRLIRTSGDLEVRAFDRSEMAAYDPEALQVFSRKIAKDLVPGDQICVFSSDFVGMAREKLNLSANASDILPLYHKAVADAVQELPGPDMTSKAHALRAQMNEIDPALELPTVQAVRHWIDVAALIEAPRDEVRPQAPRNRQHYLCFMSALGISEDVARHYWDWGIFWTRSMRIRSGAAFHQVFMGILVDPHATASRLPEARRHDLWRIYETAEHHVVTVESNEPEAG